MLVMGLMMTSGADVQGGISITTIEACLNRSSVTSHHYLPIYHRQSHPPQSFSSPSIDDANPTPSPSPSSKQSSFHSPSPTSPGMLSPNMLPTAVQAGKPSSSHTMLAASNRAVIVLGRHVVALLMTIEIVMSLEGAFGSAACPETDIFVSVPRWALVFGLTLG